MDRKLKSPAEMRAGIAAGAKTEHLPPTTTFVIDETIRGQRYQGTFSYKVPTLADQILIGQMKNRYLPGGGAADPQSAALVEYICYLEVTLTAKPTWWTPMEFTEADLVMKVYAEALAYANKFLGRDTKRGSANEGDEGEDGSGDDPDSESDVGEALPGADERSKTVIAHSSRA